MLDEIKRNFPRGIIEGSEQGNQTTLVVEPASLLALARYLNEAGFTYPADITAVDDGQALQVHYRIYSVEKKEYVLLKAPTARKGGRVPTVCTVWRGAEWFEREVFDLFGVMFDKHPDLRRILLPADAVGHPLLKD